MDHLLQCLYGIDCIDAPGNVLCLLNCEDLDQCLTDAVWMVKIVGTKITLPQFSLTGDSLETCRYIGFTYLVS